MTLDGKPGGRRRAGDGNRRARHGRPKEGGRRITHTRLARVLTIASIVVVLVGITVVVAVITKHVTPDRRAASPQAQTSSQNPAQTTAPAQPTTPPSASPTPAGATDPDSLKADFAKLAASLHAKTGLVVSAVGGGHEPLVLGGDWQGQDGPAWSTIKVPLVIAAYRHADPQKVTDAMRAAITESDNAAAEKLWAELGDSATAGKHVQEILQETGDLTTTVQSERVRPPFTPFGQTKWPLVNQAQFLASAFCNKANDPIFDLMGQIEAGQSWGIGRLTGTQFKGGWGPSTTGQYLVRQIGVLTTAGGKIAVAMATEPASGSFDDGTRDLDQVTTWLSQHLGALPAGQCGQ